MLTARFCAMFQVKYAVSPHMTPYFFAVFLNCLTFAGTSLKGGVWGSVMTSSFDDFGCILSFFHELIDNNIAQVLKFRIFFSNRQEQSANMTRAIGRI